MFNIYKSMLFEPFVGMQQMHKYKTVILLFYYAIKCRQHIKNAILNTYNKRLTQLNI